MIKDIDMTKLYLCGPMTGYVDFNFPAFDAAEIELLAVGYEVHNPATFGIEPGWTWKDYLRKDLKTILEVDGIATLDNFQCSKGARLETHVAHELEIPVLPVHVWLENAKVRV